MRTNFTHGLLAMALCAALAFVASCSGGGGDDDSGGGSPAPAVLGGQQPDTGGPVAGGPSAEMLAARLDGVPANPSAAATLGVTVGGEVTQHRYALVHGGSDCQGAVYSDWKAKGTPITDALGDDGQKVLCVLAQGMDAKRKMTLSSLSYLWVKDSTPPGSTASLPGGGFGPAATLGGTTIVSGSGSDNLSGLTLVEVSVKNESTGQCLNTAASAFDAGCPTFLSASGLASWTFTVNDSVFASGTSYLFESRASDGAGNVQASLGQVQGTWDSTPPATPATFTATTGAEKVDLAWSAASGAATYLIIARADSAVTYVPVAGTVYSAGQSLGSGNVVAYAGSALAVSHTGLEPYRSYYYKLYGIDAAKNVGSPANVVGLPIERNKFRGIGDAYVYGPDRRVGIEWQPFDDSSTSLASIVYDVYRANASGDFDFAAAPVITVTGVSTVRFQDPAVSDDSYYVVRERRPGSTDGNVNELRVRFGAGTHHKVASTGRYFGSNPLTNTYLRANWAVWADPWNNFLFSGHNGVLHVLCQETASAEYCKGRTLGRVYTIAGKDGLYDGSSGGIATSTPMGDIADVVVDGSGNVYMADRTYNRVRVLCNAPLSAGVCYGKPKGYVFRILGTGALADGGDGVVATETPIGVPYAVGVDTLGNVFISDSSYRRVRAICYVTSSGFCSGKTRGNVYQVLGTGALADGADDSLPATTSIGETRALYVDARGNIYLGDWTYYRVRALCYNVAAGAGFCAGKTAGNHYRLAGTGAAGDGANNVAAATAAMGTIYGLVVDSGGNIYLGDVNYFRIRAICQNTSAGGYCSGKTVGNTYHLAGTGASGDGVDESLGIITATGAPSELSLDTDGNIYWADNTNFRVRALCKNTSGSGYCSGKIPDYSYRVVGTGASAQGWQYMAATSTPIGVLQGSAVDSHGNVYVADSTSGRVRVICYDTTFGMCSGKVDGYTYFVAGNGTVADGATAGLAIATSIGAPSGIAVDSVGNLYIAENTTRRIRVVCHDVAAAGYCNGKISGYSYRAIGSGVAGDALDNLAAATANIGGAVAIAVDAHGNVFLSDTAYFRVRVACYDVASAGFCNARTAGNLYRYGGTGASVDGADNAVSASTAMGAVYGLGLDSVGNVYLADFTYKRLRVVCNSLSAGFCVGKTVGNVYRLAGTGVAGDGLSDSVAASTAIGDAYGVVVDGNDNVFVADGTYRRIRAICVNTAGGYCTGRTAGNQYRVFGTGVVSDGVSNFDAAQVGIDMTGMQPLSINAAGDFYMTGVNGALRYFIGY